MSQDALTRDYSKFYTDVETAIKMCEIAELGSNMKILEPHAGRGNIVIYINKILHNSIPLSNNKPSFRHTCEIHAVELQPKAADYCKMYNNIDVMYIGDFLKIPFSSYTFDRIIANPPFGNGIDLMQHFIKMFSLLKKKGTLVTILPKDFELPISSPYQEIKEIIPLYNWGTNKDGSKTEIQIVKILKK